MTTSSCWAYLEAHKTHRHTGSSSAGKKDVELVLSRRRLPAKGIMGKVLWNNGSFPPRAKELQNSCDDDDDWFCVGGAKQFVPFCPGRAALKAHTFFKHWKVWRARFLKQEVTTWGLFCWGTEDGSHAIKDCQVPLICKRRGKRENFATFL